MTLQQMAQTAWERFWYGDSKSMTVKQMIRRIRRGETYYPAKFNITKGPDYDPEKAARQISMAYREAAQDVA